MISDKVINVKDNIYDITDETISIREAILSIYSKFMGQYFDIILEKDDNQIHVLKSTDNIIFVEDYPCPLCDQQHKATIHEDSKLFINCENTRIYYVETDEERTIIPRCFECNKRLGKISFEEWKSGNYERYCSEHNSSSTEKISCDKCGMEYETSAIDLIPGIAHYCPKCNFEIQKEEIKQAEELEKLELKKEHNNSPRGELTQSTQTQIKSTQTTMDQFCTMLIDVNKLKETEFQFRDYLDQQHCAFLAESMKNLGKNIEAIIVRKIRNSPDYEIISGHHRVAAAKQAHIKYVKCEVIDVTDAEAIEVSLVSNFTRKEMDALEEARAIAKYKELLQYTNAQIGQKLGKSEQWVSARLALLNTPKEVQRFLSEGSVSVGHVKAVSSLDEKEQKKLIKKAVSNGFSVRELEKLAAEKKKEQEEKERKKKAFEDFEKYILNNKEDLISKKISSTEIWNEKEATNYYDIYWYDLVTEAKLDDIIDQYDMYDRDRDQVLKILTNNGFTVVDGRALYNAKREEEQKIAQEQKAKEIEKNPCPHCDVAVEFQDKKICPFGEYNNSPGCEHFSSDVYLWEISEKVQDICYICRQKIQPVKFRTRINDYPTAYVCAKCFYESISDKTIAFHSCVTCKIRGACDIQYKLYKLAEQSDFAFKMILEECQYYIDEKESDWLKFTADTTGYILMDQLRNKHNFDTLAELVEYVKENNIDHNIILANPQDDENDETEEKLTELKDRIEHPEKYQKYELTVDGEEGNKRYFLLSFNEDIELEFDEIKDMVEAIKDLNINLEQIDAIDDEAVEVFENIKNYLQE
ncbi:MAG: ParB/RepB/Spo0J family partition protein [Candidatus Heimdallarchaeum endolithica]|uniref:ParB/RepB/Spo0J family partition protein n=1 Tax=Candidatus Heimdallarchaeum endolithica TaxID=2876572 RepID=A0A9Y1BRH9_9ARCH|nr:MAG: ParB/RepB/Spo0J family partition protein [Candidatus Heimdallarchaeum endolithica]